MDEKKPENVDAGRVSSESPDAEPVTGHRWSGWPGAYCLRCHSEQVLGKAVAEDWLSFDENNAPVWKSDDHKALVGLCDGFCYADMTPEQREAHKAKIKVLCDKIGYVG